MSSNAPHLIEDANRQEWRKRLIRRLVQADIDEIVMPAANSNTPPLPLPARSCEMVSFNASDGQSGNYGAPSPAGGASTESPEIAEDFLSTWERVDKRRAMRTQLIMMAGEYSRWSRLLSGTMRVVATTVATLFVGVALYPLVGEASLDPRAPSTASRSSATPAGSSTARHQETHVRQASTVDGDALANQETIRTTTTRVSGLQPTTVPRDKGSSMPPLMAIAMEQASVGGWRSKLPQVEISTTATDLRAGASSIGVASRIENTARDKSAPNPAVTKPILQAAVATPSRPVAPTHSSSRGPRAVKYEPPMALGKPIGTTAERVLGEASRMVILTAKAVRPHAGATSRNAGEAKRDASKRKGSIANAPAAAASAPASETLVAPRRPPVDSWSPFSRSN